MFKKKPICNTNYENKHIITNRCIDFENRLCLMVSEYKY